MFRYGIISGPYFCVFSPNIGKYGPEITPYLDTFHAVHMLLIFNSEDHGEGNRSTLICPLIYLRQNQIYLFHSTMIAGT